MSAPEVEVVADVRIVPAKRTASYEVAIPGACVVTGNVLAKDVTLRSSYGTANDRGVVRLPKTLEAVDALIALAQAVRAELVEQGFES